MTKVSWTERVSEGAPAVAAAARAPTRVSVLSLGTTRLDSNRSLSRDAVLGARDDHQGLVRQLGSAPGLQVANNGTAVELMRSIRDWAKALARHAPGEVAACLMFTGPGYTSPSGERGLCGVDGKPSGAGVVLLSRVAALLDQVLPNRPVHAVFNTSFGGDGSRTITPMAPKGLAEAPLLRANDVVIFGHSDSGVGRGDTLRSHFSLAFAHALDTAPDVIDPRGFVRRLGAILDSGRDPGSVWYSGPRHPGAHHLLPSLVPHTRVSFGAEARQYNAEIEGYYGLMGTGQIPGKLVLIRSVDVDPNDYAQSGDYWDWNGATPNAFPTDFEATSTPRSRRPTYAAGGPWERHDYMLFSGSANNAPPSVPGTGQFFRIGVGGGAGTSWKDIYLWRHAGSGTNRVHEWWARASGLSTVSSGLYGIAHNAGDILRHKVVTAGPGGASDFYYLSTTGTI